MAVTVPRPGETRLTPAPAGVELSDGNAPVADDQPEEEYPLDLVGGAWNGIVDSYGEALNDDPKARPVLEKGDLLESLYDVVAKRRAIQESVSRAMPSLGLVRRAAERFDVRGRSESMPRRRVRGS